MSKFTKAIAAIMLMVAVVCAACTKDPENGGNGGGNGSGSNPTTEGIYLGIIGFNYNLYPKEISLLNTSTKSSFTSFIDNLRMENLTGLYYADYNALKELKSFGEPPKLTNVALVTFTDGLDNASLDDSERNPENYPTRDAYLNALNNKIRIDKVHGLDINAYTIGLRGNDVQDVAAFQNNLKKLASNDNNVFEVTSMDEALQRFEEIAESLHSTSTTTSLSLLVPPGYDDGLILRFTFDQVNSVSNSSLFIECTYKRTNEGRRLENISYHGFKSGASSLSSVEKLSNGFYKFVFENLKKNDDSFITEVDKQRLKLYRQISTGWEPETEFDNNNQSSVIEEQSSALIMLVLDCTTSLGGQFSSLKTGAKRFVETLVSSNGGGNNGGGNGGGGNSSGSVPEGAINGKFSVSATQQVYFSQGNLQYQASTGIWQFATNQYDYIGDANSNISSSYSGWIDLFGWGTSGWNCGNTYYRPWDSNNSCAECYGPIDQNLIGGYVNSDWGYYNTISNGGNTMHQWRTLSQSEWHYMFHARSTTSGIRYAKAQVNDVNGIIMLPDNWSSSNYTLYSTNSGEANFSSNVISSDIWTNSLEPLGVVFLPASGFRGTTVNSVGMGGCYWSASYSNSTDAYFINFRDGRLDTNYPGYRCLGRSVRLVCSVE